MASERIEVVLGFQADTTRAKASIQDLMNSLSKISNLGNLNSTNLAAPIKEAAVSAKQLQSALLQAYDAKTGNINLSAFQNSIKATGNTVEGLSKNLLSAGLSGEKAFSNIQRVVTQSNISWNKSTTLVGKFVGELKKAASWQISTSAIRAFTSTIQQAYQYAQDLNESLTNIQIVTQHNSEYMADFAERANKAAQALSTTTTAYTDAALIFYQQGLNDEEVEKRTDVTIKMAQATGDSATTVSSYMTAIWNNFDDGSESLEHYADVITALGAHTASSSSEIAAGIQKFASVAETAGLSYEYATSALATVVATTRQSADTVGTAFKTLFARIQDLELGETLDDGTTLGTYSQALAKVGVDIKDTSGNLKSMDDILDDLGGKWETLSDDTQIAVAQAVAGTRQYTQLMALMENWDQFKVNLGTAEDSEGTLQTQADIYAESWEAARARVKSALQGIYQSLIDDNFFINLDNGFASLLKGVNSLINGMGGLKTVLFAISTLVVNRMQAQITQTLNSFREKISGIFDATKGLFSIVGNTKNIFKIAFGSPETKVAAFEQIKKSLQESASQSQQLSVKLNQVGQSVQPVSVGFQEQQKGLEKINELTNILQQNSSNFTQYDRERIQNQLMYLEQLNAEKAENSQTLDLLKEENAELQQNSAITSKIAEENMSKNLSISSNSDSQFFATFEAGFQHLGASINSSLGELSADKTVVGEMVEGMSELSTYTKIWDNTLGKTDASMSDILASIKQQVESTQGMSPILKQQLLNLIESDKSLKDSSATYTIFQQKAKQLLNTYQQICTELGVNENRQSEILAYANKIAAAEIKKNDLNQQYNLSLKMTVQNLQNGLKSIQSFGGYISSAFSSISSIGMMFTSMTNLVDTLGDSTATLGQKLTAIGMTGTMAFSAVNNIIGIASKAMNALTASTDLSTAAIDQEAIAQAAAAVGAKARAAAEAELNVIEKNNIAVQIAKQFQGESLIAISKKQTEAEMRKAIVDKLSGKAIYDNLTAEQKEIVVNELLRQSKDGVAKADSRGIIAALKNTLGIKAESAAIDKETAKLIAEAQAQRQAAAAKAAAAGVIGLVVVAVVALIAVLVVLISKHKTAAEKAQAMAEALSETADSVAELTDQIQDQIDSIGTLSDEYSSLYDSLSNATIGTQEYYDALAQVKEKQAEIIEDFPELLKVGSIWNEDGTLNSEKFAEYYDDVIAGASEEAAEFSAYTSGKSEIANAQASKMDYGANYQAMGYLDTDGFVKVDQNTFTGKQQEDLSQLTPLMYDFNIGSLTARNDTQSAANLIASTINEIARSDLETFFNGTEQEQNALIQDYLSDSKIIFGENFEENQQYITLMTDMINELMNSQSFKTAKEGYNNEGVIKTAANSTAAGLGYTGDDVRIASAYFQSQDYTSEDENKKQDDFEDEFKQIFNNTSATGYREVIDAIYKTTGIDYGGEQFIYDKDADEYTIGSGDNKLSYSIDELYQLLSKYRDETQIDTNIEDSKKITSDLANEDRAYIWGTASDSGVNYTALNDANVDSLLAQFLQSGSLEGINLQQQQILSQLSPDDIVNYIATQTGLSTERIKEIYGDSIGIQLSDAVNNLNPNEIKENVIDKTSGITQKVYTTLASKQDKNGNEILSLDQQQKMANNLINIYDQLGNEGTTAFQSILNTIDEADWGEFIEAFDEVDWTQNGAMEEFEEKLTQAGITLPEDTSLLKQFNNEMYNHSRTLNTVNDEYQTLITNLGAAKDILEDIKVGDIISDEDYQKLIAYNDALKQYFAYAGKDSSGKDQWISTNNYDDMGIQISNDLSSMAEILSKYAELKAEGTEAANYLANNTGDDQETDLSLAARAYGLTDEDGENSAILTEAGLTSQNIYDAWQTIHEAEESGTIADQSKYDEALSVVTQFWDTYTDVANNAMDGVYDSTQAQEAGLALLCDSVQEMQALLDAGDIDPEVYDKMYDAILSKQAEALDLDTEYIQDLADDFYDSLDEADYTDKTTGSVDTQRMETDAAKAAIAYARLNRGVEDLNENYDDYVDVMADIRKANEAADKTFVRQSDSYQNIIDDMSDILDIDADYLKDLDKESDFLSKIDASTFYDAAAGEESAIQEISQAYRNSLIEAQGYTDATTQHLENAFDNLTPGEVIDDAYLLTFLQDLINMREQAGVAADEIQNELTGMGVSLDTGTLYYDYDQAVAAAKAYGGLIMQELGTNVEAENVQIDNNDTVENPSYTETYDYDEIGPGEEITDEDTTGNVITYTPKRFAFTKTVDTDMNTDTAENQETKTAWRVYNAKGDSYGGNVSVSNKTTPGSSSSSGSGNSSGSGSSSSSKKHTASKKSNSNRYKNVTNSYNNLQTKLDRINKTKDRVFGKSRIEAIEDETKAIDEQIKVLDEWIKEAEGYAKEDLNTLKNGTATYTDSETGQEYTVAAGENWLGMSINVDSITGTITNEEEIRDKLDEMYESARQTYITTMDDDDSAQTRWDAFNAQYDAFLANLDQYNETIEEVNDKLDEREDKLEEKYDEMLDGITTDIEFNITINDKQMELLDYYIDKIADNAYDAAKNISLLGEKLEGTNYDIQATREGLKEIFSMHGLSDDFVSLLEAGDESAINQLIELGNSGEMTQDTLDALEEYYSDIISYNQNLMDIRDEMFESLSDYFDQALDDMDRYIDRIDHLQSVTENYSNILDIVGKKSLTSAMVDSGKTAKEATDLISNLTKTLRQTQNQEALNLLSANKSKKEELASQLQQLYAARSQISDEESLRLMDEQIAAVQDEYASAEEDFMQSWEDALQSAADMFESAIDDVVDEFGTAVSGLAGSLEALADELDFQDEIEDEYLPDYERVYELSKLTRDINNDIDDTDNIKAKQELLELQDEINQDLEDEQDMSQYDLDYLKARYELKKAELELEEARNTKSTVRMTRDNEGNYGYVYTADDSAVDDAEQNYEDKLYELQKLNAEYIDELQSNISDLYSDIPDTISDLAEKYGTDTEEFQEHLAEYVEGWQTEFDFFSSQMAGVVDNNKTLYEEDIANYANYIKNMALLTEEYTDNFGDTILADILGVDNLDDLRTVFNDSLSTAYDSSIEASNDYAKQNAAAMEIAGTSMADYTTDATSDLENISDESQTMADAISDATLEIDDSFAEVCDSLLNFQDSYDTTIDDIINRNEALAESFSKVIEGYKTFQHATTIEAEAEEEETEGTQIESTESTESSSSSNSSSKSAPVVGSYVKLKSNATLYNDVGGGWGRDSANYYGYSGKITQIYGSGKYRYNVNNRGWAKLTDFVGYDTGGYTGDWNSDDGKVALLHQKEMVLNKDDTVNFLSAIDMVRQISSLIDLNASAASGGLGSMIASTIKDSVGNDTLEQQVSVTAEFPNVNSKQEILDAFSDIANLASQYANR